MSDDVDVLAEAVMAEVGVEEAVDLRHNFEWSAWVVNASPFVPAYIMKSTLPIQIETLLQCVHRLIYEHFPVEDPSDY